MRLEDIFVLLIRDNLPQRRRRKVSQLFFDLSQLLLHLFHPLFELGHAPRETPRKEARAVLKRFVQAFAQRSRLREILPHVAL